MKRFVLYKNGEVIGSYKCKRYAKKRFWRVLVFYALASDDIRLVDSENNNEIILGYEQTTI